MNQFWLALIVFILLGLTPVLVATVANRRERRAASSDQRRTT